MPLNQHVQVESELGGMKILLVNESTAPEDRDAVLDDFARSIGRQQSKVDLARAVMDLLNTKREIVGYPERRVEYQKSRAMERAHLRSQMEQGHAARGKRADFVPSTAQRQQIANFDAATEQKLAEFDANLEAKKQLVPIYEAQIERLKGIIEGKDSIEVPLQEAAEIQLLAAE
jgi:G3E family GTPase